MKLGFLMYIPLGNNSPHKTSASQHWEVPGSLSGLGSGWGRVSHENLYFLIPFLFRLSS